jgi:hypothetical protein
MTTRNDVVTDTYPGDGTPKITIVTRKPDPRAEAKRANATGQAVADALDPALAEIVRVLKVVALAAAEGRPSAPAPPVKELDDARKVELLLAAAKAISGRDDLTLDDASPTTPMTQERQIELLQQAAAIIGRRDQQSAFLRDALPARASAEHHATALETIEASRQRLGSLPAFTLYWRQGGTMTPRGETGWNDEGQLSMWLDTQMPLAEVTQAVAHECQHVADLSSGHPYSHAELERRAATFGSLFAAK